MSDLQARLDAAITEAREAIVFCASKMIEDDKIDGWQGNVNVNRAIDHYAALVAVRARLEEAHRHAHVVPKGHYCGPCQRNLELTAEAERLLGEAG